VRVKICGIRSLRDAMWAVEAGADALGFVFYEGSPRYVTKKEAAEIIEKLPPFIERVGLFVNSSISEIERVCVECNISLAQLHFDIDENFLERLRVKALPVVRAKTPEDLTKFADRYRLVDAFVKEYGGTGKRIDIRWFEDVDRSKIVLAGGLTPQNVSQVAGMGFYGVDVSSGVEASKGVKDKEKIFEFVRRAKGFE